MHSGFSPQHQKKILQYVEIGDCAERIKTGLITAMFIIYLFTFCGTAT
jgi:hypothetical protein